MYEFLIQLTAPVSYLLTFTIHRDNNQHSLDLTVFRKAQSHYDFFLNA